MLLMLADASDTLTIKEIAKKIGVSSRTILREMPKIEKWIKENGFKLIKKPGVGLQLDETLENRARMKELLKQENIEKSYTPQERQFILINELLKMKEPVKLYYFKSMFNVTSGTITKDLDKIEGWFEKHNLKLIRKPGFGVYVEGKEEDFRQALIDLLYENLDIDQLIHILNKKVEGSIDTQNKIEVNVRNRLFNLIDKQTTMKIEDIVQSIENKMGRKLTDSAFVGLVVHLALAVQRIKNNEKIIINKEILEELKSTSEFNFAKLLAEKITETFKVNIPEDEIGYITMHLRGAKIYNSDKIEEEVIQKFELIKIAKEMLKVVENETGYILRYNDRLLLDLVTHLIPAINRLKLNLSIRNPLLEEIKENYPEIFEISTKSAKVLEEKYNVKIPESEIGYIAMHLGAVIEGNVSQKEALYNVVVVCASGIGTSKMLAARLEREFKSIKIIDVVSNIELDNNWLSDNNIELIISTTNIENEQVDTVVVTPFLTDEDKLKIEGKLRKVDKIRKMRKKPRKSKPKSTSSFKNNMKLIREYSDSILQLLNNFYFKDNVCVNSIEELIEFVSQLMIEEDHKKVLADKLKAREKQGHTILKDKKIILLHCRSKVVKEISCGVVKLKNKINNNLTNQEISTALILIAPKESSKASLEVISEISRALVENEYLTEILISKGKDEIYEEFSKLLNNFYSAKARNI
ncbi:BglG family transcription antiterminator [Thermohalobacter berrensis]|nr:PRD domain-containing protein [Thermohalobacter berrensis]